jgi:hypothetical protein
MEPIANCRISIKGKNHTYLPPLHPFPPREGEMSIYGAIIPGKFRIPHSEFRIQGAMFSLLFEGFDDILIIKDIP